MTNQQSTNASDSASDWQSKFPRKFIFMLALTQLLFTVVIIILEIASLALTRDPNAVGAGIWCAIPFIIACILTFIAAKKRTVVWANRAFIAQIFLIIFTCVVIGVTGNFISKYKTRIEYLYASDPISYRPYHRKLGVTQAELAFAVLLMFTGFVYLGAYSLAVYFIIWKQDHGLNYSI